MNDASAQATNDKCNKNATSVYRVSITKEKIMNYTEIAENRQSCRSYDSSRSVENEKLDCILAAARLSPSACNGQPYQITVCKGETAKKVAKATQGMGMNKIKTDEQLLICSLK